MKNLLEVENISVSFSGIKALSEIHFILNPGEIKALIGPNGAGKTTLFNVVAGYVKPDSGCIKLNGKEIQHLPTYKIAKRGIRRTFQNGGLFSEMTVLENLLTGLHSEIEGSIFGLLMGLPKTRKFEREAVKKARKLLHLMDLEHLEDIAAKSLSGGQQRMIEIIRTISTMPPVLMLDEPAVGLAPLVRDQLMSIVRDLAKKEGMAIILIEHAIDLIMKDADSIIVLNSGQIIADGTPEEIKSDKNVLEAYLGHA